MTTKKDMIGKVESLLGPEGCTELAEAMFPALEESGLIDFDGQIGYWFSSKYYADHDNHWWEYALDKALAALQPR
jgi:hypothetical protein